jgi:hypothetical protein
MKKKMSVSIGAKKFLILFLACAFACTSAMAQDAAASINKAKEAYKQNSPARKAAIIAQAESRKAAAKQNQAARQQTAVENKAERKAAAADSVVTAEEAKGIYEANSNQRRTNATAKKETVTANTATRRTKIKAAAANAKAGAKQ